MNDTVFHDILIFHHIPTPSHTLSRFCSIFKSSDGQHGAAWQLAMGASSRSSDKLEVAVAEAQGATVAG